MREAQFAIYVVYILVCLFVPLPTRFLPGLGAPARAAGWYDLFFFFGGGGGVCVCVVFYSLFWIIMKMFCFSTDRRLRGSTRRTPRKHTKYIPT